MWTRRAWMAATALAGCRKKEARGFIGHAFVANQEGRAIAAVDLSVLAVVRHLRLEADPTEVVADPARRSVYVLMPAGGVLQQIKGDRLEPGWRVALGHTVDSIRMGGDGKTLWALSRSGGHLTGIDLDLRKVTGKVPVGEASWFELGPAGTQMEGWAAVSLPRQGRCVLVKLDGKEKRAIELGSETGAVAFRKDGRRVMVADKGRRELAIYDTADGVILVRLPLPMRPDRMAMKADGGQVFLTGEGSDSVVTVYPYQNEIGGITLAGRAPGFTALSRNPSYLFVTNPLSGDVTIVNVASQKVMAVAQVGRTPSYVAVTPNDEYALVLNRDSGTMAVLHVPSLTARRNKSATALTMIPVGSGPVSAAVLGV